MLKRIIFDIGEVQCSFMQDLCDVKGLGTVNHNKLFEDWLGRALTRVLLFPFAKGAVVKHTLPAAAVALVESVSHHSQSVLFHWCHFPNNIRIITGLRLDGSDLLIEYVPTE